MLKGVQRKYKTQYRVKNWRDYNEFLAQRAAFSVWVSPEALQNWSGQGRFRYSDEAIDAILMLRSVFQLPLRQATGLVRSVLLLLGHDLPVPDISTLSRRGRDTASFATTSNGRARDLAIDSTGIRLHGSRHPAKVQGARRHRNGWRKLHIIVDVDTGEIVAAKLTSPNVHDVEIAPDLVENLTNPIRRLYGDGAYRSLWLGKWVRQFYPGRADPMTPVGVFPPNIMDIKNSKKIGRSSASDEDVHLVKERGWRAWRRIRGYGKREAVERAFSRLKRILGFRLRSRTEAGLQAEALRMIRVLNVMNGIGRPVVTKIG